MTADLDIFDMAGVEQLRVSRLSGAGLYRLGSLRPGFYAGKLEATADNGDSLTKVVKMVVR